MNKEQLISKWKEFCFDLVDARNKNLLETPYQERIENGLRQWGWSKAKGEILPKKRFEIGNNNSLEPDILISVDNKPSFVIEVKRPSNTIKPRQELQLFSYMRQSFVPIGLYVGADIRMYYDDNSGKISCVWILPIQGEAEEGWQFVKFFARTPFDIETIISFCKNKKSEIETNEAMATLQKQFIEQGGDIVVKLLLESYFVDSKNLNRKMVKDTLSKYNFHITTGEEHTNVTEQETIPQPLNASYILASSPDNATVGKYSHDTTKFSIDGGKNYYGKGKLVREIVAKYVETNPKLTFSQLEQIFPSELQGSYGVIKSVETLAQMKQERKDLERRYYMNDDQLLCSGDKVKFAVCSQWGKYNFPHILDRLKQWGWNVIHE